MCRSGFDASFFVQLLRWEEKKRARISKSPGIKAVLQQVVPALL